jgi:membrane-associated phospholipid phosphatase
MVAAMPMLQKLRFDFAPEWIALLAIAMLDIVWARAIGFHLIIGWYDGRVLGLGLCVAIALRLATVRKGAAMAEYFSLTMAAAALFGVLSYLCLASSGPLVDAQLAAADRSLGFDWLAGYRFLLAHPLPTRILQFAYNSMAYQGLYFCILFALTNRRSEMREMFWLVLVIGLLTSVGVILFPALGPFKLFNAGPPDSFVAEIERVHNGRNLSFALTQLRGVVSFPSFHTAMALAYSWAFRRTGIIGWTIAGLNLAMLISIPYCGGHYLVDVIAGAAVMLVSLAVVANAPRLWNRLSEANASPECAAKSADAY